MLDKKTKERIKEQSETYAEEYVIGASAEAERAQILVECLKLIRKDMPGGSWFAKTIDKALTKYNNPK